MSKRDEWRKVLETEVAHWSRLSAEQLIFEVGSGREYEVEFESKTYQVEVELLENTAQYVNVIAAVDDGTLPASIRPEARAFIVPKAKQP